MEDRVLEAARSGDLNELKQMFKADPSSVITPVGENGAIHSAAKSDQADVVSLLLEFGVDINTTDEDGMTALHRAADGNVRTVQLLIERGANLNIRDKQGYTPASLAISGQTEEGLEIANMLFQAGSEKDLLCACLLGDLNKVKEILDLNPDTICRTDPMTLLAGTMFIGSFGLTDDRVRIVEILFARGLKPEKKDVLQLIESCSASNLHAFLPPLTHSITLK